MKNFMPVNLTTQIKWINFLEDINYQNLVFEYIEFIVKNTNLPSPDNFIGEFVQAFNE